MDVTGYTRAKDAPGTNPQHGYGNSAFNPETDSELRYMRSKVDHLEKKNQILERSLMDLKAAEGASSRPEDYFMRSRHSEIILTEKDSEIAKLKQDLNLLLEKHCRFVTSNCQLQDEAEQLKSKLEVKNQELERALAGNYLLKKQLEENALLQDLLQQNSAGDGRAQGGYSNAGDRQAQGGYSNADADINNSQGEYTSSVSDGLKQAVQFALQQQRQLRILQETVIHQNLKIKDLVQQLYDRQDISIRGAVNQAGGNDFRGISKSAPGISTEETTLGSNLDYKVCPSGAALRPRSFDDVYLGSSDVDRTPKTNQNLSKFTFQESNSGTTQDDSVTTEAQNRNKTVPSSALKDDRTCPLCGTTFCGCLDEFEQHVDRCISVSAAASVTQERQCPMCTKIFPDEIPQADFEVHVQNHFVNNGDHLDFEHLAV